MVKYNRLEYLVKKKGKSYQEKNEVCELRKFFGFEKQVVRNLDINDYIEMKKSNPEMNDGEIAKKLGVSRSCVVDAKKKHGIRSSDFKEDPKKVRYERFLELQEKYPGKPKGFLARLMGVRLSVISQDKKHYEETYKKSS